MYLRPGLRLEVMKAEIQMFHSSVCTGPWERRRFTCQHWAVERNQCGSRFYRSGGCQSRALGWLCCPLLTRMETCAVLCFLRVGEAYNEASSLSVWLTQVQRTGAGKQPVVFTSYCGSVFWDFYCFWSPKPAFSILPPLWQRPSYPLNCLKSDNWWCGQFLLPWLLQCTFFSLLS